MKTKLTGALMLALTIALLLTIVPAMAYFNKVSFNGQGFLEDGSNGYVLQTELCGVFNGAEVTGPYLFWNLAAPDAKHAEISGPWGSTVMTRNGNGTFTYISGWYGSEDLAAHPVKAVYDGRPREAKLTVNHGCAPN